MLTGMVCVLVKISGIIEKDQIMVWGIGELSWVMMDSNTFVRYHTYE